MDSLQDETLGCRIFPGLRQSGLSVFRPNQVRMGLRSPEKRLLSRCLTVTLLESQACASRTLHIGFG
jgi:hypothetical protein